MIKLTLQEANPELAKQWHPTKNGSLMPNDVTLHSGKKVWWLCTKNHEWQAVVAQRTDGTGCPYCAGKATCNDNCLATLNPDLAKEWHPTKNGSLMPNDITLHSGKKVWWLCTKNHEWQAVVAHRSNGTGCPYCLGNAVCNDNCLAILNPDLAKEWHPTKNGSLMPNDITTGSSKKVWWLCTKNKNHEWQTTVASRSSGIGCPYCAGKAICNDNCLAILNPGLAKEWHPTKNGSLTPNDITTGSSKKVWWLCTENKNHVWQAVIAHRSNGTGCPYCLGKATCNDNCLATLNPDLTREWHSTKNGSLTPNNITLHSGKKVWWLCTKNKSHEWQATVADRSSGRRCPYCFAQISQLELRVYCELKHIFPSAISKKKLFGKECDVYIPEIKAGVEVDGVYWHRDKYMKDKQKSNAIRNKGITLIRVREAGLRRISDTDILCAPKDDALTVIKKIAIALNERCNLNLDKRKAIDKYLQRQTVANDSEYKKLWDMLPSPLPGLSLSEQKPELVAEWHKDKNGTLSPTDVSLFSGRKIWWICNKGHEWQAEVAHRSNGAGCPYCSGNAVCNDNCLSTLNPDLTREWHPTKNGSLMPNDVTLYSGNKVWWLCTENKNHVWQSTVANRSNGTGCPYCSGNAVCNDNCLATLNPGLAKEWHPTKNGSLMPNDITIGSSNKVWWLCTENKNHVWQTTVAHRNSGQGCPYCIGRAVCNDNCLAILSPGLAKEWHPTKNGSLMPNDITIGSSNKVWWLCTKNKSHEWQAPVKHRSSGFGCPYCAGKAVCNDNYLATLNPGLAKEWHPTKNGSLTPNDVTLYSGKKVWWLCTKNHEWQTTVAHRSSGQRCPYCSGNATCNDNCLATLNPGLAKEWHRTKNGSLTPRDVTLHSSKKVWWKCNKGHEWQATVDKRSNGRGCPKCRSLKLPKYA